MYRFVTILKQQSSTFKHLSQVLKETETLKCLSLLINILLHIYKLEQCITQSSGFLDNTIKQVLELYDIDLVCCLCFKKNKEVFHHKSRLTISSSTSSCPWKSQLYLRHGSKKLFGCVKYLNDRQNIRILTYLQYHQFSYNEISKLPKTRKCSNFHDPTQKNKVFDSIPIMR